VRTLEPDYLVVGGGATGLAFVDALVASTQAEVVVVDRRTGPGGHWRDAYPFVQLHQPAATYGVDSLQLGDERIETTGPNAGFYALATGGEVRDYFDQALAQLDATGQVTFLGGHDHVCTAGGHEVLRRLDSSEQVAVRARRKVVDATYLESSIPSTHTPSYAVDAGVTLLTPNALPDLGPTRGGFTVLGGGKTATDTVSWLLDHGVDPDRIRWVRPRDGWFFNRAHMQPRALVGSFMYLQGQWVRAAAETTGGADFAARLEDAGVFLRVDRGHEPLMFRGATISEGEIAQLATVRGVVRRGKVRRIATDRIHLDEGELASDRDETYVDCTAAGVRPTRARPVFERGRITPQYVTTGFACWSAATIAKVEALPVDDAERNALTPVIGFTGATADLPALVLGSLVGTAARGAVPELSAWDSGSRLNPTRDVGDHLDDPRVLEAFASFGTHLGQAMSNLRAIT
jgi:hypothetical protein